jgi:tetratricopeptide (TPR) repeat protein
MRTLYAGLLVLVAASAARAQEQDSTTAPAEDAVAAPGEPTPSDPTATARAHFKLGVDFYRERNFRAALIEFRRAYADAPNYKLLYNLGQASVELQEYAGAIDYFSQYLRDGGDAVMPERRTEVEDTLRYLESRIARVTISSNRDGAEVYVDDTLVGRVPLSAPVRVGAGRHKFTAVTEGTQPVERMVDVAAQEQREIRLEFEDRSAVLPASPEGADVVYAEAPEGSNTAAIVAGVTTAVLAAGTITMTVLTAIAQKSYKDELNKLTTEDDLHDLRKDAETKALITDIALGATVVSGIVTTILIFTGGDDPAEHAARERQTAGVGVKLGLTGVAVDGRF